MRRSTPFVLDPLTESAPGVPGEMNFDANVGAPAATTDANVIDIRRFQKPALADGTNSLQFEVGRTWQLKGRIGGAPAATANIKVTLWCYDRVSEQWYPMAELSFVGSTLLSGNVGNVKDMAAVLGTDYVGFQITGIVSTQELNLMMYEAME